MVAGPEKSFCGLVWATCNEMAWLWPRKPGALRFQMTALEQIKPGSRIRGLEGSSVAEVVSVSWFGSTRWTWSTRGRARRAASRVPVRRE